MNKVCLVAIDIRSTHNVGSFLRTADGFSAEVVLVGITPYPFRTNGDDRLPHVSQKTNQAISKTALGAEKSVKWRNFLDYKEAFRVLRKENFVITAIEQDISSEMMDNKSFNKNTNHALVMGTEVSGLPSEILKSCDRVIEIPMMGQKESFNVSVAAGIALYQTRN